MAWAEPPTYRQRPVVVLGGGVLGRRIAACWVSAGWHVIIRDPSEKSRQDALSYVQENMATYLALSHGQPGSVDAVEDFETAVQNAWLVFEAVPEILSLKENTFLDLEKYAPADCILASNSSSYKSSELLGKVQDITKERVLNTHYMMPPQALIVELMTSGHTAPAIFPFMERELRRAGLHPVTAKRESTGFIFNRIWAAIKREVLAVIAEGVADPATIDAIWTEQYQSPVVTGSLGNGMEWPTLTRSVDSVGLDTVEHIEEHYVKERHLPTTILEWLHKNYVEPGKLGNKSNLGGLYPAPRHGHGTKILVLNIYQGSYPGELHPRDMLASGQILEVPLNNKTARPVALITGQKMPDGIDVYDGRMYWTAMGVPSDNDGAVYSAKLDGTDIQTVIAVGDVHTPKQLHIDAASRQMYFCDREGLRVHRCNLDGSNHEVIVRTGNWRVETDKKDDPRYWPVGITVSNKLRKIFWTQKGGSKAGQGRIFSASIDMPPGEDATTRTDIETVLENLPEPIDLEFDDDNCVLYWTDRGELPFGNTLNKKTFAADVPKEESQFGRQIIAQGFGEAIGLRLDHATQRIYVADICGRLWECGTQPGPKTRIYEAPGHAYTGLALVKY